MVEVCPPKKKVWENPIKLTVQRPEGTFYIRCLPSFQLSKFGMCILSSLPLEKSTFSLNMCVLPSYFLNKDILLHYSFLSNLFFIMRIDNKLGHRGQRPGLTFLPTKYPGPASGHSNFLSNTGGSHSLSCRCLWQTISSLTLPSSVISPGDSG